MNDGKAIALRRVIRRSNGKEPLAIFVGRKKAAVQAIGVRHQLLREKNSQPQRPGMGVQYVHSAFDSRTTGGAREKWLVKEGPEGCNVRPGTNTCPGICVGSAEAGTAPSERSEARISATPLASSVLDGYRLRGQLPARPTP